MSRTGEILTRPYTMALYTLQDSYKATLHGVGAEGMGHIQDPKITLKDDGTQELTFTIPMYIRDKSGKLVENPSWFNIDYGSLITGMEKVKVIFGDIYFDSNSGIYLENENCIANDVFEFIITKVNENHSEGILKCEVTCEGLAFHELGKNGRILSLNSDLYQLESDVCYTGFIPTVNPFSSYSGLWLDEDDPDGYSLDLTFQDKVANSYTQKINKVTVASPYVNLAIDTTISLSTNNSYTFSFTSNVSNSNIKWKIFNREYTSLNTTNEITLTLTENEVNNYVYYIPITFSGAKGDVDPVLSDFKFILNDDIKANINYWMDKVVEGTDWTYSIRMDWAAYDGIVVESDYNLMTSSQREALNIERENNNLRRMDTVYEDEYASAWALDDSGKLTPIAKENFKEKERTIDDSESNRYNITQDIAEKFEVNCKYKYYYDENLHIIKKEIIFFNNFIKDKNPVDITYPYDTSEITRELDSTDIVTKLYVTDIDDDTNLKSGKISIIDSSANKSGENYILNFDYLYNIGAITTDQYNEISSYEASLYDINKQISNISNNIAIYQEILQKKEGLKTSCDNSLAECADQIDEANKMLASMTGDSSYTVKIDGTNYVSYVVLTNSTNQKKYITIRESGVIVSSIKVYTDQTLSTSSALKIDTELTNVEKSYTEVYFTSVPSSSNMLYAQYTYKPSSYYTSIKDTYSTLYNQKYAEKEQLEEDIKKYSSLVESNENELNILKRKKNKIITDFDNYFGPAIREGSWQDDDYNDYGEKRDADLTLSNGNYISSNDEVAFIYDEDYIDGEQLNYYQSGVLQTKVYYSYIDISNHLSELKKYQDDLCFVYGKCWNELSSVNVQTATYIKDDTTLEIKSVVIGGITYSVWSDSVAYTENKKVYYDGKIYNCTCANTNKAPGAYCTDNIFRINSQLIPALYKNSSSKIIPVLIILDEGIEVDEEGDITYGLNLDTIRLNSYFATQSTSIDDDNNVTTITQYISSVSSSEIIQGTSTNTMVYPRIIIKNLDIKIQTSEDSISPKVSYYASGKETTKIFDQYNDYSMLAQYSGITEAGKTITDRYSITIKPYSIFINGVKELNYYVNYIISNASTSLYLDALKVAKENAFPKVSYTVKINAVNDDLIEKLYARLDQICYINDSDLKFDSVRGYISEIILNLDEPWADEITIQNYKTKFEDLFSSIVAATEEIKSNSTSYNTAASAITSSGAITSSALQQTISSGTINYNFDSGNLTISEENGIWATSDDGVVAYRGGGISIASSKDDSGNWQWHTGITPNGINASMLNAGQLNTEKISIFAGDQTAFQLNSTGLYAYKQLNTNEFTENEYVVHNGEGLFLVNKAGQYVVDNDDGTTSTITLEEDINRVEISWDGLKIRNLENTEVFNADNLGNLKITGNITANSGAIGDWLIGNGGLYYLKDNNIFYISPNGNGTDENVIYIQGEKNTFKVDKYGVVTGTSAVFSESLVANNATINGIPFSAILDNVDIEPKVTLTSLRGNTFKEDAGGEFYPSELRFIISSYDIGEDINVDALKLQVNETGEESDWFDFGVRTTESNYWEEIEMLSSVSSEIDEWDEDENYIYGDQVKYLNRYYKYINYSNSESGIAPCSYIALQSKVQTENDYSYYYIKEEIGESSNTITLMLKPAVVFNEQNIAIRVVYGDYISEDYNLYMTHDGTSGDSVTISASNYGWKGSNIEEELTATLIVNGEAIPTDEISDYYYIWFKTDYRHEQKNIYYDASLSEDDNISGRGKNRITLTVEDTPETMRIGCTVTNNYDEFCQMVGISG